MPKKNVRKVRVQSERSQPYVMTPKKAKATASLHQRLRDQANRIVELEGKIAAMARGDHAFAGFIEVSPQCAAVLDRLTETGLYGNTTQDTAAELLTAKVRSEMAWLATGNTSP